MFTSFTDLRHVLCRIIDDKAEQGHVTKGLDDRLGDLPESYDAFYAFAQELADLPLRDDWPYVEPDDLPGIEQEAEGCAAPIAVEADRVAARRAGFLASVCGCQLGKPVEVRPTLDELRKALEAVGDWPLDDYVRPEALDALGRRAWCWPFTTRGNFAAAAPDDDINYTVLGMLVLENHGGAFTWQDLAAQWQTNLPHGWTFGPERTVLARLNEVTGLPRQVRDITDEQMRTWVNVLNPGDELCGAMIRADAYGYACPGDPQRAARLAWRDASFTHRRTGVYGTMFAAAAIAAAFTADGPLDIFETALKVVPRRSRFYAAVADGLDMVAGASDWLDAYQRIHRKYKQYDHCRVLQESATLINTLRFADSPGRGICMQVMQGNDTDSYGATVGSILGCYMGDIEPRWLEPFNDRIHTTLATFHEQSLAAVADRMARLPSLLKPLAA